VACQCLVYICDITAEFVNKSFVNMSFECCFSSRFITLYFRCDISNECSVIVSRHNHRLGVYMQCK